jgi:extracellular factor (EF) 3-hydroxypalmitic acid methyl ester biosynthesis protein
VEIQEFIRRSADYDRLEFVLIDFNEETLEYARQQLVSAGEGRVPRLKIRHESVNQLLKRASRDNHAPEDEKFDYVYCAGLFDYLTDKVCSRLIAYFASRCNEQGRILLTNVHSANPERHWMEHFLEWYLIYRNEADLVRVLPTGLADVTTYTDATGINVFLEATVRGGATAP